MAYFSIIIPVFNKENFIINTIKSVLNQTFIDFELIIINDGSTDTSEQKVLQFKDSRIKYYSKENEGVSLARNLGIEKATTDFITFLDADDYWHPSFLQEMHQNCVQFPELKVFSAAIEIETSKKTIPAKYSVKKTNEFEIVNYFEASTKESILWTSSSVFHKSVFERIGNFDIAIKSGQDTDLWIRIGLIFPIVFSWKILARYVYDSKSLSRNLTFSKEKLNFSKFKEEEIVNPNLKKFLDLNRFSLAVKAKIQGENILFETYYKDIDLRNLSFKKKMLLNLPSIILIQLIKIKAILASNGLGSTVFK